MEQQLAQSEVARLEAITRSDSGSRAFAALCEAHRRSGRPEEAERVAREGLRRHPEQTAGRVALGLALIDLGRIDEARSELTRVLDAVPDHALAQAAFPGAEAAVAEADFLEGIAEGELEQAFADAEPETEQMIDADGVAAAVVSAVDDEPETAEGGSESPFATPTMANLLESQGHEEEARRLRASLDEPAPEEARAADTLDEPQADEDQDRVVRTLEGWLQNLRKGRR